MAKIKIEIRLVMLFSCLIKGASTLIGTQDRLYRMLRKCNNW